MRLADPLADGCLGLGRATRMDACDLSELQAVCDTPLIQLSPLLIIPGGQRRSPQPLLMGGL